MSEARVRRRIRTTIPLVAVGVGTATALLIVALLLFVPLPIRHAAPFGAEQTIDFRRGLAVMGAEVTPNYDRFDRVDLDLRGYSDPVAGGRYDLILTIRDLVTGEMARTVPFSAGASEIDASRSSFSPRATTVRFEAIEASAGRTYYVDVERGPRNAADVITLWGVQTSSTLTGSDVLWAALEGYDLGLSARMNRIVLAVLSVAALVALSATAGGLAAATRPSGQGTR